MYSALVKDGDRAASTNGSAASWCHTSGSAQQAHPSRKPLDYGMTYL